MAVYYKIYQDNRSSNPNKGKWYGRAAMIETDTTDDLAKAIEEKCTVNEADVLAVIKALVSEITRSLQASHRVKLPGFGTFKLGMSTRPADSRKDFTASNITGVHVLFQPELKISSDGTRTRTFLTGSKVRELTKYYSGADDDSDSSKSGDDSGKAGDEGQGGDTNL